MLLEFAAAGIGGRISASYASGLLDRITVTDEAARYRILIAREVVDDIARFDATMKASKQRIARAVTASGTLLTNIVGVGPIGATTIIGYTKNVSRFPTRSHYATYNATAPIDVSSAGNTKHRFNLRGNRILNRAIHIAAVTQLRHDTIGRTYCQNGNVDLIWPYRARLIRPHLVGGRRGSVALVGNVRVERRAAFKRTREEGSDG